MVSWEAYIKEELKKEPGILLLAYPYTFLWNPVSEAKVKEVWKNPNSLKEKVVYVHIPFCKRKCTFCNFVSYFNIPYSLTKKYIGYLKKEMEMLSPLTSSFTTTSLCIGGGTPNIFKEKESEYILKIIHKFMNLNKEIEMSIELTPDDSINASKLKLLKDYRINRISLGIQSFDDRIKRICNRFDTAQQNIKIYNIARKIGFNNINFDLIFGLPNQTFRSWLKTLTLTAKLGPEHISVYPLSARHSQISLYEYAKRIDVKKMINTFNFTKKFLTKEGYFQISRYWYVKRGVSYKYNECCSDLVPLLGLGLNSISYNSNFTYKNTPDLKKYFSALNQDKLPIENGYTFIEKDRMRNYIIRKITYLRIDREDFKKNFGRDMGYYFGKIIRILTKFNLIKVDKKYIKLTSQGIFYTALVKRCFYNFNILKAKEAFYKNIS